MRQIQVQMFKGCSRFNAHKYFFSNRITEIWNALPSAFVEASSFNVFQQMLDCVDLTTYCLLLVFQDFWFSSVRELSDVVAYIDLLVFLCILLCRCVYMYVIMLGQV